MTAWMTAALLRANSAWALGVRGLQAAQGLAQLAARVYVAGVFWRSGLTKLRSWDNTLALFREEYHVPLLTPEVAAVLGTCGEVGLPVLLVLGFGGRFAALGLFVVNLMAALSLPDLPEAALQLHVFWGSLLAGLAMWGPGPLAVERWVWPRVQAWLARLTRS